MIYYKINNIPYLSEDNVKHHTWDSFEFFLLYDSNILSNIKFNNVNSGSEFTEKQFNDEQNVIYCYFDKQNIIKNPEYNDVINIYSNENKMYFSCYDELCMFIECSNIINGQVGLIILNKTDDKINIFKLHNGMYLKIKDLTLSKKYLTNINQFYIELYQKNDLKSFLPHYSPFSNDISFRVNSSFKTLSNNILNLYHATRNKKNVDIYNNLTDSYKKILFNIHGQYMVSKNNETNKSITVHDIYYLLKSIETDFLIKLYKDTIILKKKNINIEQIIDVKCIHLLTQINLM